MGSPSRCRSPWRRSAEAPWHRGAGSLRGTPASEPLLDSLVLSGRQSEGRHGPRISRRAPIYTGIALHIGPTAGLAHRRIGGYCLAHPAQTRLARLATSAAEADRTTRRLPVHLVGSPAGRKALGFRIINIE